MTMMTMLVIMAITIILFMMDVSIMIRGGGGCDPYMSVVVIITTSLPTHMLTMVSMVISSMTVIMSMMIMIIMLTMMMLIMIMHMFMTMMMNYGGDADTTYDTDDTYDGECGGHDCAIINGEYNEAVHTIVAYTVYGVATG